MKTDRKPYHGHLPKGMFDRIPKEVWADIALSFAMLRIDGDPDTNTWNEYVHRAADLCAHEWHLLYLQGIVRQKPRVPDPGNID